MFGVFFGFIVSQNIETMFFSVVTLTFSRQEREENLLGSREEVNVSRGGGSSFSYPQ